VARILIVAGGCRGRELARALIADGHAVRITTRSEAGRDAIEQLGAECWVGTPDRLATLRGALDRVAVACWLLGTATGSEQELAALHGTRLELFLVQSIDTTVRGLLYECGLGGEDDALLAGGARTARRLTDENRIPAAFLTADPADLGTWLGQALAAIASFLAVDH
jgi:uncharacterized protein YbjT (DUF2867 family)